MLGEQLENQVPPARDIQAFLVFSQHVKWVYYTGKAIEIRSIAFIE